jgi:putative endonuclease
MNYFVYAIRSLVDGRIYVGLTGDVEKRIKQHNDGKTQSTRPYRPWKLIHQESFENRKDARAREKYLKSGSGKEYLKNKYPL